MFATEQQAEAGFIASEIKRLMRHTVAACCGERFVILCELYWVRQFRISPLNLCMLVFTALSRAMETALQHEGIPSRVLAGKMFFERLELDLI